MRMMRIMRICGICGCVCGLKISSTLYTYDYLPKMATFWARNGSAWLCFQFWVPKISFFFAIWCGSCASDAHQCTSAKLGAWPSLQWTLSCVHCVQFEDSFENADWRKVKQLQPVRLCMLWIKFFWKNEFFFVGPAHSPLSQFQPLHSCARLKWFERTHEKTQRN